MPQALDCLTDTCLKCLSIQVFLECSSASNARVYKSLECQLPKPFEYTLSAQFRFKCSLSKERPQHYWKLTTGNFIEFFKNFSEYIFQITLFFFFFGNEIGKFYHVLLARGNHSRGVSKAFLKYFVRCQKTEYDGLESFLFSKIVYSSSLQFYYCSCRTT